VIQTIDIIITFLLEVDTVGVETETLVRGINGHRYWSMSSDGNLECIHTSGGDIDPSFDLETHRGLIEMAVAVLTKVGAVGVFCWNASMFHHPFVSSEVFPRDDAERAYYEKLSGVKGSSGSSSLTEQIARARDHIKNSLECVDGLVSNISNGEDMALVKKLNDLEIENKQLKKVTDDLKALVLSLEARVGQLEGSKTSAPAAASKPAPAPAAAAEDDDDDDVDLFGSDDEEESEEKKRITEERLAAYHAKKSKKPQVIAKTSVLLDVKPWDDETPHEKMLESCKSIEMDGLVWGASKLVPIGYGIQKLQVMCTVEDEKVSVDELCEKIQEFEDYVQSVDVAAMNKI